MVKTPFTLLQKQVEMAPRNAIELPQMALRLAPEILYSVYVVQPISKSLAVVDSVMLELRKVQYIITLIGIRIDDAVWLDLLSDDGNQCLAPAVRYHHHIDLPIAFQQPEYRNFACCSTSTLAFALTAKVTFICLNLPLEQTCLFIMVIDDFP